MTGHVSPLRGEPGGLPEGRETGLEKREGPKQRKTLNAVAWDMGPLRHTQNLCWAGVRETSPFMGD